MLAPTRPGGSALRLRPRPQPLSEMVQLALRRTGHADLQIVEVTDVDGNVRLSGTVRSFFAKQTAQVVAAAVPGIRRLDNKLAVVQQGGRGGLNPTSDGSC